MTYRDQSLQAEIAARRVAARRRATTESEAVAPSSHWLWWAAGLAASVALAWVALG